MLAKNRRMVAMLARRQPRCGRALQFLDPLLFGHVIGLLARTDTTPHAQLFADGTSAWSWRGCMIGACGIGVNIAVAMGAERLAHRTRLGAIQRCFDHVLALPKLVPLRACSRAAC